LVSPYSAYLRPKDLLIESEYEPYASNKAGIIHSDITVRLPESQLGSILTELSSQRLHAALELKNGEVEIHSEKSPAPIGSLIDATTKSGQPITIGAPLEENDIRLEYQSLLLQIVEWATAKTEAKTSSLFQKFIEIFKKSTQIESTIAPITSYAMSNENESYKLQVAGLELMPEGEEEGQTLIIQVKNIKDESIDLNIYNNNQLEQRLVLPPQKSDQFIIEKNQPYRLKIIPKTSSPITLEFTL
jgi:hypothetical protein